MNADYVFFAVDDTGEVLNVSGLDVPRIMKELDDMDDIFFLYRVSDGVVQVYMEGSWSEMDWFVELDEIDSK